MATGDKRQSTNQLSKFPVDFPTGSILAFGGTTAPTGWAICDGSLLSRTEYVSLFNTIGTLHGEGDGSTTFHLPDYRGRFLRGADLASGRDVDSGTRTAANAGGAVGDNVGSVQDAEIASHTHTYQRSPNQNADYDGIAGGDRELGNKGEITGTSNPTGGNETRPINASVNYIIKL